MPICRALPCAAIALGLVSQTWDCNGKELAVLMSQQERAIVLCNIEVPQVVLTSDDCCNPHVRIPSPLPWDEEYEEPVPSRRIEFRVPAGSAPGCSLRVPVHENDKPVEVSLPGSAAPGDALYLLHLPSGAWKARKKLTTFSFTVPECEVGQELKLQAIDGTVLSFLVPAGLESGELVTLKLQGDEWALEQVHVLPVPKAVPNLPEQICGPYAAALRVVKSSGYLEQLPVDSQGVLHVSAPFCGRFQEYSVLGGFLADVCLSMPGVRSVRLIGTDCLDVYNFEWAVASRWFETFWPQIRLQLCVRDLAEDPLPEAAFVIGVHPEVTKGGPWFPIIGSVLRSANRGLCLFATFFEDEVKTLQNMIEMYCGTDTKATVVQNPYYEEHGGVDAEMTGMNPRMCKLVLVAGSALSPVG